MGARGFTVPPAGSADAQGSLLLDNGIHSGRPEAQADACYRACITYNTLADSNPALASPYRCDAITVVATQSITRVYMDVWYSGNNLRRGTIMCSSPVPNKASCHLLTGAAAARFVPVLITRTRYQLAHADCLLSAPVPSAPGAVCQSPAVWAPWAPLFHPDGTHAQTSVAAAHGPACSCPPGFAGALCDLKVDTTCAVPQTTPLLDAHCSAVAAPVLHEGQVYAARTCDETILDMVCQVCTDPARYGPLCALDKCLVASGAPRCHARALACVQGFCVCPPGWDPASGCAACADGFALQGGDCQLVPACWAGWNGHDASFGWFVRGSHGGRGQVCNGHGVCSGSTCVCDTLWGGSTCTVDMAQCQLQSAVQQYRSSVVGACFLPALDTSVVREGACPTGEHAFTITNTLAPDQGWKACALLNARVDVWNAEDSVQAAHCVGVAPPGTPNATVQQVETVPGPGCDWTDSMRPVYGANTSLGMPVRCRGYACGPLGVLPTAEFAELVPLPGIPTRFDVRAACRRAQAAPHERTRVANDYEADTMQQRQLRGGVASDTTHFQHLILWYLLDGVDTLVWRSQVFVWMGTADGSVGEWQRLVEPSYIAQAASSYQEPDPGEPGALPHTHVAACVVQAPFQPNSARSPSTPVAQGGATMLLDLPVSL